MKTIHAKQIRCLQIVDSGTLGLKGRTWNALVFQEGSVEKPGNAPGGSNGVGKNAVLNVSDLRTVFYCTRYVQAREGRVEKLQGKAVLMDHPNPRNNSERVQHVGFYTMPQGEPVLTTQIPDFFRLSEVGTGVFIMGFNPRSKDWIKEVTSAVVENFFYAIHHKKLVVKIDALNANYVLINHETLDWLFKRESNSRPAIHYYKAIRDVKPHLTEPIGKIGPLNVHVFIGSGPRRTAYINRNGMLITDSREQKVNPIAPRGKSLWPDYCVVVAPETDRGDEWIRQTENTSHDAMSPKQCFEGSELADAERWFRLARSTVSQVIDEAAQVQRYGDTTNLNELAAMFPDEFDPAMTGNRVLRTKITDLQHVFSQLIAPEPQPGPDFEPAPEPGPEPPGPGPGPGPGPKPGPEPKPSPGPGPQPGQRRRRRPRIEHLRFIPTEQTSAILAFTPTGEPQELAFRLRPAGGEWGQEVPIEVVSAEVVSPLGQQARIENGAVHLTPRSNERVVIEINTSDPLDNLAFRLG